MYYNRIPRTPPRTTTALRRPKLLQPYKNRPNYNLIGTVPRTRATYYKQNKTPLAYYNPNLVLGLLHHVSLSIQGNSSVGAAGSPPWSIGAAIQGQSQSSGWDNPTAALARRDPSSCKDTCEASQSAVAQGATSALEVGTLTGALPPHHVIDRAACRRRPFTRTQHAASAKSRGRYCLDSAVGGQQKALCSQ
jgi:hypothetical protein